MGELIGAYKSSVSLNSALNLPSLEDLEGGFVNTGAGAHITTTDHGAVDQALSFAEDALGDNIDLVEEIGGQALNVIETVNDNASGNVGELISAVEMLQESNAQLHLESLQQNAATSQAAIQALEDSNTENVDLFRALSDDQTDLFRDIYTEQGEQYRDLSNDQGDLVREIMSETNESNTENLETIKQFAETTATDGQNLFIDLIKWIGIGLIVAVVIIVIAVAVTR